MFVVCVKGVNCRFFIRDDVYGGRLVLLVVKVWFKVVCKEMKMLLNCVMLLKYNLSFK